MKNWKINDDVVIPFPKDWGEDEIMKWVNADYIRICPRCNKLDASRDHFKDCNPGRERVKEINRDMRGW